MDSAKNGEADGSGRDEAFADRIRSTASRCGVSVLGATYHIMDGREDVLNAPDFAHPDFVQIGPPKGIEVMDFD